MNLAYPISTNLMSLILFVTHLLKRECVRQCGVKLVHFRILSSLLRNDDVQCINAIAQGLHLSPSTITTTTNGMETDGLVTRVTEINNRRTVLIKVTESGRACAEATEVVLAKVISDLWEPLSDEHKRTLLRGTAKIDTAHSSEKEIKQQIRTITAYINVYLITLYEFTAATRGMGLSVNEFRILFELNAQHLGIRPSDLGRLLLLSPAEITATTDKLVKRGCVCRSRDVSDHRVLNLELSSDGYSVLCRAAPVVDTAFLSGVVDTTHRECGLYLEIADIIIGRQQSLYTAFH